MAKNDIYDLLNNSSIPDDILYKLRFLQPTLINRYHRRYYRSYDRKYRVTFDTNIEFRSFFKFRTLINYKHCDDSIFELKYDSNFNSHVSNILSYLPFRLSKYSKYVVGIQNLTRVFD